MYDLTTRNRVAAYLYLHLAEQMPENAPDEWFLGPDPCRISLDEVDRFMRETRCLLREIHRLGSDRQPADYMYEFYEAAKRAFGEERSSIRQYFRWLYLVVFGYESGPRWGEFVAIYGPSEFIALVNKRFREL